MTISSNRMRLRFLLTLLGIAVLTAVPGSQSGACDRTGRLNRSNSLPGFDRGPNVRVSRQLMRNSSRDQRSILVRRSARRSQRDYCWPQVLANPCVIATGASTAIQQYGDLVERTAVKLSDEARAVTQSNNQFAFDLYHDLNREDGNKFFSPISIETAFAMTYAGAEGQTKKQMADVLHFDLPDQRLHEGFGMLNGILNRKNENYRLNMANRLWVQSGFAFKPQFVSSVRDNYGDALGEVDFAEGEQTRQTINQWITQNTNGNILELIPPGIFNDKIRLVLTNAIYFKGTWQYQFSKTETKDQPFFLSKDRPINVPMMHQQTGGLRYGVVDNVQLLELPYAGGDLSLVILLPTKIDGLPELEKRLTANDVQKWISGLRDDFDVVVDVPKFKITSTLRLNEVLSTLGMPLAFSDQADFSSISAQKAQKLYEALHQAIVIVNEEGTEAAAATGHIGGDAPGPVPQEAVFRADHPFLFLIQDKRTGAILFIGRVVNPNE